MTLRARTTLIVGVAAVAVIAGLAVVGWPWVMERYWAARFADEELSIDERVEAGLWLAKERSQLWPRVSMSLLSGHEIGEIGTHPSRKQDLVFHVVGQSLELAREAFPEVLKETLENGDDHARFYAARMSRLLYAWFCIDEVAAGLVNACQSLDMRVQVECSGVLARATRWWDLGTDTERQGMTLDRLADRWGCSREELLQAFRWLLASPHRSARGACAAILEDETLAKEVRENLTDEFQEALDWELNPPGVE